MKKIIRLSIALVAILSGSIIQSTNPPIEFDSMHPGLKGHYWPNTLQDGLGRAQVNGRNFEAVKEINLKPDQIKDVWVYDLAQTIAIFNMKIDIKNTYIIGKIITQNHSSQEIARAQQELNNLPHISMEAVLRHQVSTAAYQANEQRRHHLFNIINSKKTVTLIGIRTTPTS